MLRLKNSYVKVINTTTSKVMFRNKILPQEKFYANFNEYDNHLYLDKSKFPNPRKGVVFYVNREQFNFFKNRKDIVTDTESTFYTCPSNQETIWEIKKFNLKNLN